TRNSKETSKSVCDKNVQWAYYNLEQQLCLHHQPHMLRFYRFPGSLSPLNRASLSSKTFFRFLYTIQGIVLVSLKLRQPHIIRRPSCIVRSTGVIEMTLVASGSPDNITHDAGARRK
ncbi:hypothetical protein GJ744_001705, partial [Endocarpon pusillum]